MNIRTRKKLIEVALPLEAINTASAREKSIRHGHPSTLHLWWARRPLAAARAVIFSQMVDDPSSVPELFPTEEAQEKERQRLFKLIEELVKWENTTNEAVLNQAREEIWKSWRRACEDNKDHPQAKELFNPEKLPAFHDPFAGGGSLPLEAQRLGLEAYASDLNPVAVLINKAMIEIPPKFAGRAPVNSESRKDKRLLEKQWHGVEGLAEDVRYYGKWMRDEAEKRIGHLYPKVEITATMAKDRPDLKPLVGQRLTVIAWLWARTVKSPNPAFSHVDVPLASTFMLSTKAAERSYVQPVIESGRYHFTVKVGEPKDAKSIENGTKLARGANFRCLMSGSPISGDYIKAEGRSGRMGSCLMAIVAERDGHRIYLDPISEHEVTAHKAQTNCNLETVLPDDPRNFWTVQYGLTTHEDLFTPRQLLALKTFSDLVKETCQKICQDAASTGMSDTQRGLNARGLGAMAYAEAAGTYLCLGVGRSANYWSSLTPWGGSFIVQTFGRPVIPMVWDYAEGNPFSNSTGNWSGALEWIERVIANAFPASGKGEAWQDDAQTQSASAGKVISTDPPYYDNINYADLSDFFYTWHRRLFKHIFPNLCVTLTTPKEEELVASPYRRGGKDQAEIFFLDGMTEAMRRLSEQTHPAFPVTIYYAFKQAETRADGGTTSTGWETFLDAVTRARFTVSGTWPMRTERDQGLKTGTNVLASSIVLVCRPFATDDKTVTRRELNASLKTELPTAIAQLQRGNIAPVDLAQAAIGPGMAIYTRYPKVIDAGGKSLSVRDALAIINQVLDEVLAEQEGDFDPETRWALAWFEQSAFDAGEYGVAEILSKAKNTSVEGMKGKGILDRRSPGGKVRLLRPIELPEDWDPAPDQPMTAWEIVHHLIRVLEAGGEVSAAQLLSRLGPKANVARELAYRLYNICERKKRAPEAASYNGLVQSWPEMVRIAQKTATPMPEQATLI